jgi:hypothetical protein
MAKLQRVFKRGVDYYVEGPSELSRRLRFVGSFKIDGLEHLIFRPVRKVVKKKSRGD